MKMKKLITVTALALAAVSIVSTRASAQNAQLGDMILSFEVNDGTGTGSNTNLEIDLGTATNFIPSYSVNSFSQVVAADLINTYGSNWNTRTDLVWGISGATSNDGSNKFATTINSASPRVALSLATPYGDIASLSSGFNTGTVGSSASAVTVGSNTTPASSIANSYTSLLTTSPTADYGFFGAGQTQDVNTTGPDGSLELYGYFQSGKVSGKYPLATAEGLFTLSSAADGSTVDLSFNPQAVPEPSSYVLGVCAAVLFFVLRRRSKLVA